MIMRFVRWLDIRHSKKRKKKRKDFLKLHFFIVDCTSLLILSFKATPTVQIRFKTGGLPALVHQEEFSKALLKKISLFQKDMQ
jgi:hypothetical protein